MKHLKWIVIVILIISLTSFVAKDTPTGGLRVGDLAPDFKIEKLSDGHSLELNDLKGQYVLLSFWASYDAQSRMSNVSLSNALSAVPDAVKMISVSFDDYKSVCDETLRQDQIHSSYSLNVIKEGKSGIFKKYNVNRGFTNYLLDKNGVIIAKNISGKDLSNYLN